MKGDESNRPRERPLPTAAVIALGEGKVIDAIKIVREAEGIGLKEAKERVDRHVAGNPLLQAQLEEQTQAQRHRIVRWIVIADAVLLLAALYYFFGR